jgi:ubiquinone/menaquinone biosynthesis C-methylase UbiE
MTTEKTFSEIEYEAWAQRADVYEALFTQVSNQAIDPILDSLEPIMGKRHLDVACGPGHLVAEAAKRGAISQGIDFSRSMNASAQANYPGERFQVANAVALPFETGSFDAVTCAFGLPHIEQPRDAMREAFRVLKTGGWYAFTLWYGPEEGNDMYKLIQAAFHSLAVSAIILPDHWTQLRYADERACTAFTQTAGFNAPVFHRLPILWRTKSAQDVVDITVKLSVRTRMMLDDQPQAVQQQILAYIQQSVEARQVDGVIALAWPAMLVLVQKTV